MSKKIILFTFIVTTLYFSIFFASRLQKVQPIIQSTIPTSVLPNCESADKPLLFTSNEEILCKKEESIYLRKQGKKIEIKKVSKNDIYFPSSFDLILFQSDDELVIEKLLEDNTIKELYVLPLEKGIIPISIYFSASANKVLVFISAQKEAHSPKETKSIIYRIEIDGERVTIDSYSSFEMLKVIDSYQNSELLLLRELFPFLIEKHRTLEWHSKNLNALSTCSKYEISFDTFSPSTCTSAQDGKWEKTITEETGKLILHAEKSQLTWQPKDSESIQTLISNVNPQEWQLLAKYSTTIGKRVYNCFDFSESSEITLRTCIPQL